jgi:tripartite-type tricarboxylate transporter receptor subunit TctC
MRSLLYGAALCMAVSSASSGEEWPSRPITLIVPFAAGGGVDVSARIQAQRMSELLGQSIIVENVGAAGAAGGGRGRLYRP